MKNIDLKQLLKEFNAEYQFLYENEDNVAGYEEAIDWGDDFIKGHKEFVGEFVSFRGDFLLSDREVAAFAFAVQKCL